MQVQYVILNFRYKDYKPGRILHLEDKEAADVVSSGIGEYVDQPTPISEKEEIANVPTLDEFIEMTAIGQKKLLEVLQIKGDDGNEEKRVLLYTDFLKQKGEIAGGGDG